MQVSKEIELEILDKIFIVVRQSDCLRPLLKQHPLEPLLKLDLFTGRDQTVYTTSSLRDKDQYPPLSLTGRKQTATFFYGTRTTIHTCSLLRVENETVTLCNENYNQIKYPLDRVNIQ